MSKAIILQFVHELIRNFGAWSNLETQLFVSIFYTEKQRVDFSQKKHNHSFYSKFIKNTISLYFIIFASNQFIKKSIVFNNLLKSHFIKNQNSLTFSWNTSTE